MSGLSGWRLRLVASLLAALGFSTIAQIVIEILRQNEDKQTAPGSEPKR